MKNYKKIDHFEPIAMKCTQEQFEDIKPILEKFNLKFDNDLYEYFEKKDYSILTNYYNKRKRISSTLCKEENHRTYYETFNAKTFLKACGIVEDEPTTEVRNSVLLQLAENNSFSEEIIRKECPKLFPTPHDIITIVEKYGKDELQKYLDNYKN